MTAYVLELVPRMRKSHRAHVFVMTIVIAIALVSASAVLGPAPSGFTSSAPATNGPVTQSLGQDWAEGGASGFALLVDNLN